MAPLKEQFLRLVFSICYDPSRAPPSCPIPNSLLKMSLQFSLYLDSPNFTVASIALESALKLEFLHALLQIKSVPLGRD